jgi:hypothetical protein
MRSNRGAIVPGLFLIIFGLWLLARNLGLDLPGLDQLWPVFPLLGGLAFLVQYFAGGRKEDGLVFVGVAAALVGAFFFAFTLGPLEWRDMGRWWPVFVLIGAAAFLAQWLTQPREWGLLVPAGLALLVGGVALGATLRVFSSQLVTQLVQLWPVLLILAGIITLARYFFRRRAS